MRVYMNCVLSSVNRALISEDGVGVWDFCQWTFILLRLKHMNISPCRRHGIIVTTLYPLRLKPNPHTFKNFLFIQT